jgi:ABC-type lipoprotein export system ATPase subunit
MQTKNTKEIAELLYNLSGRDLDVAINELNKVANSLVQNIPRKIQYGDTLVSIKDISRKYKSGKNQVLALDRINLDIKEGEFVAITGTSGSGKSTLLQLIGGLDRPSSGEIIVNNQNISKLSDRKLSKYRNSTIGFVFQFFYLQPFLSLKTNVEVPAMFARNKPKARHDHSTQTIEAVDLSDRSNHLPRELSGGQMQRAAIARALMNKPKLLLADEPTGNLDSANAKAIFDLFEKVRNDFNTTVVVVTHDNELANKADRIIKLTDGVII